MVSSPRRPSIKTLQNRSYTEEEIYHALNALAAENSAFADYAIAIIGAAYVERSIEISMRGRFVTLTQEEEKRLFNYDYDGPLSDLAAKIKVGFAMYLFGRKTRDDLEIIRRTRNLFAHHAKPMTFSLVEVKDAIASLSIIKQLEFSKQPQLSDPRGCYIKACCTISHTMQMVVARRTTNWNPDWMGGAAPDDLP